MSKLLTKEEAKEQLARLGFKFRDRFSSSASYLTFNLIIFHSDLDRISRSSLNDLIKLQLDNLKTEIDKIKSEIA